MTTITLVKTAAEAVTFLQFIKSDLSNYPNRYHYRTAQQGTGTVFFLEFTSPEEVYYFGMRHATAQFGY